MQVQNESLYGGVVAQASEVARADFIRNTYNHLAGAIALFAVWCFVLVNSPFAPWMLSMISGGYGWLIVIGGFMGVSYIANGWAESGASREKQYMGLALYIVAEGIVFTPMLYLAAHFAGPDVLPTAALMTGLLFFGLTYTAFSTKADFSFMGSFLAIGGFVALGVIAGSILFGFTLGLFFSAAMILYAGGAVLYTTSNIIHHYRPDQHVAASLALFASVALLFYYVVSLLMSLGGDE